jgi:hypothetical protein
MFENDIERMDDARNIAEHSKQNIEPELSRQSHFEEYAHRGQENSQDNLEWICGSEDHTLSPDLKSVAVKNLRKPAAVEITP